MSLTVVGSIAFDAVETQTGSRDRLLGGSAVHFSLASSFFADTRVVGPVGDDFGEPEYAALHSRGVDHRRHRARRPAARRSSGPGATSATSTSATRSRPTSTCSSTSSPRCRTPPRAADVLFLANIQPDLQREVREQCTDARFVALDSMNLWIDIAHESLVRTIRGVDGVILNDGELKQLTDEPNLVRAARAVLDLGPDGRRRQAGRVRLGAVHARRLLRAPGLPDPRRRRPHGRGRHVRRRLHGLRRRAPRRGGRRRRCCGARWPTARCWPRSTSRRSGPSAC